MVLEPVAMQRGLWSTSLFVFQSVSVFASAATARTALGSEACGSWGGESSCSSTDAVLLLQVRAADVPAKAGSESAGYAADADADSSKPAKKIVFIKTHHTGSSTTTAIFQRFCDEHKVACAREPPNRYESGNVNKKELAEYVAHHAGKDQVDIWPWHVYYDRESFEKLMPGAFTISIFREPSARVVSCLSHQGWSAEDVRKAVDELQANGEQPKCGDKQNWHVDSLIEVDLVLLNEDYDRSLVLMARKLGWSLKDVLYTPLRVSELDHAKRMAINDFKTYISQPVEKMTETGKKFIERCIEGDKPLYNEAKERYQQQLGSLTPEEHAEVEKDVVRLQAAVKVLESCCQGNPYDLYCIVLAENVVDWHRRHDEGLARPMAIADRCHQRAVDELES